MAAQLVREWTGIHQFPAATRAKLVDLLASLKNQDVNTLTILVMGKSGVGKSSTINSIVGERVVNVSAFQSEMPKPVIVSRSHEGFTLNIIDTPGIIDGGYINGHMLDTIRSFLGRFLMNKTIDVLLYVDRLDAYRIDDLDKQVVKAITDKFGREIWHKAIVVLTHAQLSPPDALSYEEFFSKRSESLLKCVREGAPISKEDQIKSLLVRVSGVAIPCKTDDLAIPVTLVENSGRCNKNEHEEKILPSGIPWIPNMLHAITVIALNGKEGILIDRKLIEGPNPNNRGKLFIPLILAFQYLFVINPIRKKIEMDIYREDKPSWMDVRPYDQRVFGKAQYSSSDDVVVAPPRRAAADDVYFSY